MKATGRSAKSLTFFILAVALVLSAAAGASADNSGALMIVAFSSEVQILFTLFMRNQDPPRPSVFLVLRQCFDSTG